MSITVKKFHVKGLLKKPRLTLKFEKEIEATKKEDAIEKIYAEMGSKHKARRFEIQIEKVEEKPLEKKAAK